ncbi:MAG TPA: cellulase family glycosylhydrolase [Actinospica sp.]|nr:cellulase family glycosylhydrolase [Actinospica sp.]
MRHVQRRAPRTRLAAVIASLTVLTCTVLGAGTLPARAATAPAGATRDDAPLPAPHNAAMDAVAAMQPSWNLGNTLDAFPTETSWGNPLVTKKLFDTVKAEGFRSVRIPVTWSSYQSATAPYTIDPTWMARVKQVVDWALDDGLYVDLNVHHDSWQWIADMTTEHDQVLARFDATWTQIATAFKDESRRLLFESVNEPQFNNATTAQGQQMLSELNTAFFNIVRHSGGCNGTRLLVLPAIDGGNTQSDLDGLSAEMASLHDTNLVATVHYYGFWPFTVNIAGFDSFNTQTQQDLLDRFSSVYTNFVAKGIPVYMGEYATFKYPDYVDDYNAIEPGEGNKFFELMGYEARINHVTTALWDAGQFLNRNTFQQRFPALFALIQSSWKTRSGTAASDQLFIPESGPITAQTVSLNLNGTTFKGLSSGDWKLVKGRDYAVNGDQLTLPAATVARLVGSQTPGVDSTLTVRFSKGVPWTINVISYGAVTQANATGNTTDGLVIPTDFNGDVLAEMQATYADGTGAGPASWTTYQEYGASFAPNAAGNTITMTPAFLTAINDGVPVTLTFYYWSGAKTTYTITKSGTTVTGTA